MINDDTYSKIFTEISFTISDCPLANTESLAWKCSCRVCIKPSNISMQHGIQVPQNFCVSVFFLWKPFTLSNTLTITNHKPWKEKRLGNFPKTLQNQHHQETRIASRPKSHRTSCKGRILATWCAANQENPKPCIVAATNTPAPILSDKIRWFMSSV